VPSARRPPATMVASVLMLLFCLAFGLSMDYEVFLLSRIREFWLASARTAADSGRASRWAWRARAGRDGCGIADGGDLRGSHFRTGFGLEDVRCRHHCGGPGGRHPGPDWCWCRHSLRGTRHGGVGGRRGPLVALHERIGLSESGQPSQPRPGVRTGEPEPHAPRTGVCVVRPAAPRVTVRRRIRWAGWAGLSYSDGPSFRVGAVPCRLEPLFNTRKLRRARQPWQGRTRTASRAT